MLADTRTTPEVALRRAMRGLAQRLNRRVLCSDRRPPPTPLDRSDPWRARLGAAVATRRR